MKRTIATGLPVLIGAVTGAILAIVSSDPSPVSEATETHNEAPRLPAEPRLRTSPGPAETGSASTPAETAVPTGSARAPSLASPVPSQVASARASPSPSGGIVDLSPPTTREALQATQLRCERKSPEDCERAARALDTSELLPRDTQRARVLRRIALTLYVRQCDSGRALACGRLAEMYEVGEIVQPSAVSSKALRARVVELCAAKPEQAGCTP